jgi:capsular polysaccharide biosynthesis protein
MDFADVAKLLWRRWYLTAPLLLLTVAAMVWMALVVKPDYKAVGNVTLLPPRETTQAAIGTTQEVNPWEPSALAEATLIRLQSKALADSLDADGYRGEWTVTTLDTDAPIISIEVVSPTEEQARAALAALVTVVQEEVSTKQEAYKLSDGEKITTLPLEKADSVEKVTTKLKRALVVVFGVGLILTIGVAVLVDAVLRRRARRQVEDSSGAIPAPVPVVVLPPRPTMPVAASRPDLSSTQRIAPILAGPALPVKPRPTASEPAKKTGGAVYGQRRAAEVAPTSGPPAGGIRPDFSPTQNGNQSNGNGVPYAPPKPGQKPGQKPATPMPAVQIQLTQKQTDKKQADKRQADLKQAEAKDAKPAPEPAEATRPMPDDATIVLPLSNAGWAKPSSEPTEAKKP